MDDIADSYGCMTADWLDEQLTDFMYTFDNDPSGAFIAKANDLSKQYCKTGEDFVSELIAFATNQKRTHVDHTMLDLFEQQILHKVIQTNKDETSSISHTRIVFSERNENSWLGENDVSDSSATDIANENVTLSDKYLSFTPIRNSVSDVAYQSRKDSGKAVVKFTGKSFKKESDVDKKGNGRKVVVLDKCTDDSRNLLQYGAEKSMEQAEELISRVQRLFDAIKEGNETLFDDEQLDPSTSVEAGILFGFILNDTEGRLNVSSCSFQCIDENGSSVELDLSNLQTFSLFPGKVVALRGTFTGDVYVPEQVFEPIQLKVAPLSKQSNVDMLRVWCACGPFSSPKTLSYEQLCDLIELAKKEQPDILILIGPFIDRTSPAVRSSQCPIMYGEFMDVLLAKIDDALSGTDIQVLIVPNGKKDAALRPSFPTPPFRLSRHNKRQLAKNLILLPDPAIVQIAGIEFAISASEIIQHMGRDEISRLAGSENQDRISRLVGELFRQQSLYPIYPAPVEVPYRLQEALKRTSLSRIPHVIILPSVLAPTVKVVSDSLFVNPGILARAGSSVFMKLWINLIDMETNKENAPTSIIDFCDVQIVRL